MADAVVIGANGFIGSHLVDALVAEGHRVTAFDRFSAGAAFTSSGVRMLRGDFLSRSDLEAAVDGQQLVFHMLSTSTPATAEGDPTFDLRTNVAQTIDLLSLSADAGVDRFFFASTGGAIYGDQGRARYSESDPTLPVSPYGIGKLTIERYLSYFARTHGLRSLALRISNPYGPRQRAHRRQGLIPIALRRILDGQPVTRYGDGGMVRDYIYVGDVVRMIVAMVGADDLHAEYNVGSGIGTSVTEVLDALGRVTRRPVVIDEQPTPTTFVDRVILDTTRYVNRFGAPELTSMEDGIRLTVDGLETIR